MNQKFKNLKNQLDENWKNLEKPSFGKQQF